MARPSIGLTLDAEAPGGYSKFPWYALRENYCAAVEAAGGLAWCLPHEPDRVDDYLDRLDGLIVTGGAFDVPPELFGAASRHTSVVTKDRRTRFELDITREAIKRDLPVFGICGGEQLLAVALGGTLIQHIPDQIRNPLAHEQPNPRDQPGHSVQIVADTKLHTITQVDELAVNSAHHQAVALPGPRLVVNATAPDGVIEGIEDPTKPFCLGVQWHPEFFISSADRALFEAFVAVAGR